MTDNTIEKAVELFEHLPDSHSETGGEAGNVSQGSEFHEIDLDKLHKRGFLTPEHASAQLMEEFRMLKLPILKLALGRNERLDLPNANVVLVTSALEGEGKTFVAVNLAMSIAMELDTTVLLIDGNIRNRGLSRVFGLENHEGLLDVLSEEDKDLRDVIVKTNVEGLRILPAGQARNPRSTELLTSGRMRRLIAELSQRYHDRIVVIDATSLLASSQAKVLAQHAGQITVVVEAGKTTRQDIQEALGYLERDKAIGMVLNKNIWQAKGTY